MPSDIRGESKRNRPATIIVTVIAVMVFISAISSFVKIASVFDNMNTYSGAAWLARQALNNIEKVDLASIEESSAFNAGENAETLKKQKDEFRESIYALNRNQLISSDVNARNIYSVIEIRTEDFADDCDSIVSNLWKMANNESYELIIPDKDILKGRISDLVSYLERKSLE